MRLLMLGAALLALAGCAERVRGVLRPEPRPVHEGAALTYFIPAGPGAPAGTDERAHRWAALTLSDESGAFCLTPVHDATFEAVAAAAQAGRSAEPVDDLRLRSVEGEETYRFADIVVQALRAADGRWLAFDSQGRMRDADGLLYALEPAAKADVDRAVLTILIDTGACPDLSPVLRLWRDRLPTLPPRPAVNISP